jgi:ribosomal protein S30
MKPDATHRNNFLTKNKSSQKKNSKIPMKKKKKKTPRNKGSGEQRLFVLGGGSYRKFGEI